MIQKCHRKRRREKKKRKKDIILYYNETKDGLLTTDNLALIYRCKRGTRRWPVCFVI